MVIVMDEKNKTEIEYRQIIKQEANDFNHG